MSNVNITKSGGVADAFDNFPGSGLQDYTDATREYKPSYPRPDWKVEAARGALALGGVFVLWLLFTIWKAVYCLNAANWQRCDGLNEAEPLAVGALLLICGGLAMWRTVARISIDLRLAGAHAARVATTFNRFSNPVRVDLMTAPEYLPERYASDTALKRDTAPDERWHSINTFSPSYHTTGGPATGETVKLPAPLDLVPPDTWLRWAASVPHIILAAETGGGKSTTAKSILAARLADGGEVFVIDPHSSRWFDLPGVGGGENWPEVQAALEAVGAEYAARIQERERYYRETRRELPLEHFRCLTVLLDEAFLARRQLNRKRRGADSTPWLDFTQVMGSGARKVNIRLLLLTQSANCEDLDISGPMRENFLRVTLDSAASRKLIDAEERNPERRKLLHASLEGRDWPAVTEWKGQLYPLDRTGMDRYPEPVNSADYVWAAWDYAAGPVTPPDDVRKAAMEKLRERAADLDDAERARMAFSLRRQGWKMREIRYVIGASSQKTNDWANGKAAA